ncbi:hypothetical protein ACFQ2T_05070 [Methylophilus flavus]|uniref:Transposase n=1 Tax=Methylophilus flavus TaxID=640084 RepID=A0ABW3PB81_9PROT
MATFSDEKKKLIIGCIGANINLGNKQITRLLAAQGIEVGYTTVRDYRHRHFPKSARADFVASAFIKMRVKDGKRVTPSELVEKLGINMNYAYQLARKCNTQIAEKKLGLDKPLSAPVLHKTGIITRTGNLTVHRMF